MTLAEYRLKKGPTEKKKLAQQYHRRFLEAARGKPQKIPGMTWQYCQTRWVVKRTSGHRKWKKGGARGWAK